MENKGDEVSEFCYSCVHEWWIRWVIVPFPLDIQVGKDVDSAQAYRHDILDSRGRHLLYLPIALLTTPLSTYSRNIPLCLVF